MKPVDPSRAPSLSSTRRAFGGLVLGAAFASVLAAGCDDSGKRAEEHAVKTLENINPMIERDMTQLRQGLADGVVPLAKRLPADPRGDLRETQQAIKAARNNTEKLVTAKGTWFLLVGVDGQVIRSEIDPDRLVDKNVFGPFPALKGAVEGKGALAEGFGEMEEMRGVKRGNDMEWVVAHGVVGPDDKMMGAFLSGFTFRTYAAFLEDAAKRFLVEESKKAQTDRVPVVYVFLVKNGKAFGAPDTPDVNADTVLAHDVVGKSAGGLYRGQLEIEKRTFGVAAQRVKALGDDAALAVITSVY